MSCVPTLETQILTFLQATGKLPGGFSFEVLMAEQRGKLHRIALSTVIALVVLAVK